MKIVLIIIAGLFVTIQSLANVHQPVVQVPRIENAMKVDGIIGHEEYSGFTLIDEGLTWTLSDYISDSVKIYLGFDNQFLYVGFVSYILDKDAFYYFLENKKPRDSHISARHNQKISMGTANGYVNLFGGPTNTVEDSKNGHLAWDGKWEFAASINGDNWSGEFKIPFTDLDWESAPINQLIPVFFERRQGSQAEKREYVHKTGLNPDKKNDSEFRPVENFYWQGNLILVDNKSAECNAGRWEKPAIGQNDLKVNIRNLKDVENTISVKTELIPFKDNPEFINQTGQGFTIDFALNVTDAPILNTTRFNLKSRESVDGVVHYQVPNEGNYFAIVRFIDSNGAEIHSENGCWFTIEPLNQRLRNLKFLLGNCESLTEHNTTEVAKNLWGETQRKFTELESLNILKTDYQGFEKWNSLKQEVSAFEQEVYRLMHKIKTASLTGWRSLGDFGVTVAGSMDKLPNDKLYNPQFNSEYTIQVAGNEYESFQLVIFPFTASSNYNIVFSDFIDKNGNKFPASGFKTSKVGYNFIPWQSNYINTYSGWHPDPLMPFEKGFTINPKDLVCPVWVDCFVPSKTKPGNYTGEITLTCEDKTTRKIRLTLHVLNFDLPQTRSLKTHTWDDLHYMAEFYNKETFPIEDYLKMCEVLLRNNISPGFAGVNYLTKVPDENGNYDFSKVEKVLDFCIKRGLTQFSMVQMRKGEEAYTPGELEQEYRFIEAYSGFLRKKGYLDKAVVELWDEPNEKQYQFVKERAERIRAIGKDIRIQLFAEPSDAPYCFFEPEKCEKYGLCDLIDIWAPGALVDAPQVRQQGKEIWTYIATLARHNGPNLYIDCPAVNHRLIPLYCWNAGVDCFEHWHVNYFWRNLKKNQPMENKWPNVPWDSRSFDNFHGEGSLIYPGLNGETYASIRLAVFRDGVDDFEYLNILKNLAEEKSNRMDEYQKQKANRLLNLGEDLIYQFPYRIKQRPDNTIKYQGNHQILLERRSEIAGLIEELVNL